MFTRIPVLPREIILILLVAGTALVSNVATGATYYTTKITLKSATQDDLAAGKSNIATATITQKALINLAQGLAPGEKITDKNIVLALRLDNCETPEAQLVVYRKGSGAEIASVSEPFSFLVEPLLKQRSGITLSARLLAEAAIHSSAPADYSLNDGKLMLSFKSTRSSTAADDCPDTITGSLLGFVNVSFIDDKDGEQIPETKDALIVEGSNFTATRIRP